MATSTSLISTQQRRLPQTALLAGLYFLPFFLLILFDLFILEKRPIHHYGDYSGMYSLGIGWLTGQPIINLQWPLWGFSQISAGLTALLGYPQASLEPFYYSWALIHVAAMMVAARVMAEVLRLLQAPLWSAATFGLVTASQPVVSVGWLYSYPYVLMTIFLIPAMSTFTLRLSGLQKGKLLWWEYISYGMLGISIANNFPASIVLMGSFFGLILCRPYWFLPRIRLRKTVGNSSYDRSLLLSIIYAASVAAFLTSGSLALMARSEMSLMALVYGQFGVRESLFAVDGPDWEGVVYGVVGLFYKIADHFELQDMLPDAHLSVPYLAGFGWFFTLFVAQRFLSLPNINVSRYIGVVFIGWIIGTNIFSMEYVGVGLYWSERLMGTSGDTEWSLIPAINWMEVLQGGYVWYNLVMISYALGAAFLAASFFAKDQFISMVLRGCGTSALLIIFLTNAINGWDLGFPVSYEPIKFGTDGRYLWTTSAAVSLIVLGLIAWRRTAPRSASAILAVFGIVAWLAFIQAGLAKRSLIRIIDTTLNATNEQIDAHLAASPDNVVLIAHAYYPERAQILYAYHSQVMGTPPGALESLENGRVRYIGRCCASYSWTSPKEIIETEGLDESNILMIVERGKYPDYVHIDSLFPETDTGIGVIDAERLNSSADVRDR